MTKVIKTLVQNYQNSESDTSNNEIGTVVNDSDDGVYTYIGVLYSPHTLYIGNSLLTFNFKSF